ncbi:M60 family metallopeptidase [Bacteroides finegoldii]|uniref:M60 family metallopeptidase n=1 Tax=Bacteroides finegoldii TaxID=338188 RepID=UPI0018A0C9C7|nr:M60 family metallopeptidase [Bacteroides finegoldii]
MKTRKIVLPIIFSFVTACLLVSCKDDDQKAFSIFDIAANDLEQVVDKSTNSIEIPVNTTLPESEWQVESTEKWLKADKSISIGDPLINATVEENTADEARTAQIKVHSSIQDYVITVRQFGTYDIAIEGDTQILPTGGKANQFQSGYDIDKSMDGKFTTGTSYEESSNYHSPFGEGNTNFPVILEYFFTDDKEIDYFIYYTRKGNGNFGEVDVYTATISQPSENDYTLQGSYDFKMKNNPSKISFKKGTKPAAVKFVVKSGLNNFASCDEMQFFQNSENNTQEAKLLKVFKDITCTELKEGVTEQDIQELSDKYFIDLAEVIKNNAYSEWEKDFRIREYKAYSDPAVWAEKLITKRYGNQDNLTGIAVEKDDEVIVLVGDTHGYDISLQCIGEEDQGDYVQTAASGSYYILRTGINKFKMENKGQLFVMYNCDLTSHPEPIKIHIPIGSGKVSGFFDLEEHKTDLKYAELISKASDKYFGIRGDKITFYFHRESLLGSTKNEILSAIHLWDDIIGWQQELMGIEDIRPNLFNNHVFAISPEGGYMWALDDRIGFIYTYLDNILLRDKVMEKKDNAWGPAHEIGHIHQGAINWPSSTESSNNIFSNYVLYKLGKYCSRGLEISKLAESYRQKKSWALLGDNGSYKNEDTELHMRMQWQLWNYFHRLGNMPDFFPKLFKELRANPLAAGSPGTAQMQYAKAVCKVADMDMTEFFERWGFFIPEMIMNYEQYGTYMYMVSQQLIDQTKAYMATFSKKVPPIYYLEDRKNGDVGIEDYKVGDVGYYTLFQDNVKITDTPTYQLSGNNITIKNGTQAVAFEIRKDNENGELLDFFNFLSYSIPTTITIDATTKFYAVQADGKRIEMKAE